MSDVMLYGVLRMPFEMAMGDFISSHQFYQRAQEAADRLEKAEARVAELEGRATLPSPSTAEDERAAFEAWVKPRTNWWNGQTYSDLHTQIAWDAWQARTALAANAADSEAKDKALLTARAWIVTARPALTLARQSTIDAYVGVLKDIDAAMKATQKESA